MQLSRFTDYGVRVLIYLATLPDGELTRIADVSELYNISKNHLVKVIHRLGKLGYVETLQGKNGGIRLNLPPSKINIGAVVRAMEPMVLLNCSTENCYISPVCLLKMHLAQAKEAFLKSLDQYTVQDLLPNNSAAMKAFFAASPARASNNGDSIELGFPVPKVQEDDLQKDEVPVP